MHYGDDFLKLPCSQYQVYQIPLFYTAHTYNCKNEI